MEYAPHNLLTYSEQFDNAAWNKVNATTTANAIAAPNGTVTAELIAASSTSCYAYQAATIGQPTITFSVYAKPGSTDFVAIETYDGTANVRFGFNLVTLATSYQVVVSATNVSASAVSVGNGWVRCSVTFTRTGTSNCTGFIYVSDSISDISVTSGKYAFFWGAQLSVGPYALDYTPTTSAAVYGPRFDYDPTTLAPLGLLIEEQRTNLILQSNVGNIGTNWQQYGTAVLTQNYSVAPDGTVSAGRLATTTSGIVRVVSSSLTNGTTYAASIWMKSNTASSYSIDIQIGDNFIGTFTVTPTWQRFSGAGTPLVTGYNFIDLDISNNLNISVWGAQIEQGGFATSLIPTSGSTVTRSADVASVNTLSPWYSSTEGTLFAEFDFIGLNPASPGINQGVACLTDGTGASNNLGLLGYGDGSAARYGFVFSGSSLVAFLSGSASSVNTTYKSALATKANDFRLVNSGGSVISDTSGAMPTGMNQLILGNLYTTTNLTYQNGHLRRIAYYPRALTTAELQALTA